MADRHNLCVNPACKNNATGWGGDSTPTRTDVTGQGFDRQFAARYSSGTFARTPAGDVTPGLSYTLSFYRYVGGVAGGGGNTIYIEWTRSSGGPVYDSGGTSWTALTVQRFSITATAPALATTAALVIDGPYATRTIDISQILIEQAASLDTYFDGDTTNATWDGADGNSASTLSTTVTGTAAAGLTLGATSVGTRTVFGAAAASVTGTATASGTRTVLATGAATLGGVTAAASATRQVAGVAAASLSLTATIVVEVLTARTDGTLTVSGRRSGSLSASSRYSGSLSASGRYDGSLA